MDQNQKHLYSKEVQNILDENSGIRKVVTEVDGFGKEFLENIQYSQDTHTGVISVALQLNALSFIPLTIARKKIWVDFHSNGDIDIFKRTKDNQKAERLFEFKRDELKSLVFHPRTVLLTIKTTNKRLLVTYHDYYTLVRIEEVKFREMIEKTMASIAEIYKNNNVPCKWKRSFLTK